MTRSQRTPKLADLADPVYAGIEVQVSNSRGRKELTRGGTAGAIHDCLAPTKHAVNKPGEWNRDRNIRIKRILPQAIPEPYPSGVGEVG